MRALVVDDDPSILKWMAATLQPLGVTARTAGSAEEALAILETTEVAFVVTDFMMPRINGAELLARIRKLRPVMPVVVMSGVGTADDVVNVLRLGADDFLRKPIKRDLLIGRLTQVIAKARIYEEARLFRAFVDVASESTPGGIVTRSQPMLRLVSRLPSAARAETPVVVVGGPGSGKRHVAETIHALSPRREGKLVTIDCTSMNESLLETGAFAQVVDALQVGDVVTLAPEFEGTTLYFDEISALPAKAQGELVRFLQGREGSRQSARFIVGTQLNLAKRVAEGLFREDLYYLLNVVVLEVPSLEERAEDIPVLATHFLSRHAAACGSSARAFSPAAFEALVERQWPGNVRQLENVIKRALLACDSFIVDVSNFVFEEGNERTPPPAFDRNAPDVEAFPPFTRAKKEAVEAFERDYLARLLRRAPRTSDAVMLAGLDRKGLWRLMSRHGFRRSDSD